MKLKSETRQQAHHHYFIVIIQTQIKIIKLDNKLVFAMSAFYLSKGIINQTFFMELKRPNKMRL